jgi:hypothetical protein
MRDWMKMIPAQEMQSYRKAGFMGELTLGERAALIVVDVTMGFCGSRGLSLDQAIAEFPTACGPSSWIALPRIAHLIDLFRRLDRPIVYTLSDEYAKSFTGKAIQRIPGYNRAAKAGLEARQDQSLRVLPHAAGDLSHKAKHRHARLLRRRDVGLRARLGGRWFLPRLPDFRDR